MNEPKEIKKKINDWLKDQGYPLEMSVASALRSCGFDVLQSSYYSDPENENAREIDVVASWPEATGCIDISFVIECKVSKKKPWLLFSTKDTLKGVSRLFAYCIHSGSAHSTLINKIGKGESFQDLPWMKKEGRTAYGITQAFTTGDDLTFKAATGVLKAAIARKNELSKRSWKPFVFVFPIIIVDGLLFECFFNNEGEVSIENLEKSFFFFPWHIADDVGTCVHILSYGGLEKFINDAKSIADSLMSYLEEDIKLKMDAINSPYI
jgi:hypothetical protein